MVGHPKTELTYSFIDGLTTLFFTRLSRMFIIGLDEIVVCGLYCGLIAIYLNGNKSKKQVEQLCGLD